MRSIPLRQDVVYTCTMMFGPELMQAMADTADGMRPGAVFVTVMIPLPSDCWEIVCEEVPPCSLFSSVSSAMYKIDEIVSINRFLHSNCIRSDCSHFRLQYDRAAKNPLHRIDVCLRVWARACV